MFNRYAKSQSQYDRRLFIVDNHNSRLNMRFIDYADRNRIILALLPPHSTHRLQFFDIELFSPLATAYSQQINQFVAECQGFVSIIKRHFWRFFRAAWKQAFTTQNIESGRATASIHPFNSERVLAIIRRESPESFPAIT